MKQEVIDSINKEYDEFKEKILKLSNEEIFDSYYSIYVKTELMDTFNSYEFNDIIYEFLNKEKGSILSLMYDYYLKDEYASLATGSDIINFVQRYCYNYGGKR